MTDAVFDAEGIPRRELLRILGIGVPGALMLSGCSVEPAPEYPSPIHDQPDPAPFTEGVMAGDPLPWGTTLWTRLETTGTADVGVLWEVSETPNFEVLLAGGTTTATATADFTVKVQVTGLAPDRWYWYRFEALGAASRIGRLRTAPSADASASSLRFAYGSCQQLNDSHFVALSAIAREPNLDFLMHLGDYVYASDSGTQTLDHYRGLYRRWRKEPLLREVHAALPLVAMWDDGEFYNGVDRTGPPARLAAAQQAFWESMPLSSNAGAPIYRNLHWGALADLAVIDVRSQRDPAISGLDRTSGGGAAAYDPGRSTLGVTQFAWLSDQLARASGLWSLVGSGVPISPWRLLNLEFLRPFRSGMPPSAGLYAPADGFDDYVQERSALLGAASAGGRRDTIFASAHTHMYLASELRENPDVAGPVLGYDFVSGSFTADPDVKKAYLGDLPAEVAKGILRFAETWILQQNPSMRHINMEDQGYVVMDLDPERCEVEYRLINTFDPDAEPYTGARFRIRQGVPGMEILRADRPSGSIL